MLRAGQLNRKIRFERLDNAIDPNFGGSTQQWVPVVTVWAQVRDEISSAETSEKGVRIGRQSARIRMRYRPDIHSAMRVVVLRPPERVLQIVAGPAELGQREALEILAEEFSV